MSPQVDVTRALSEVVGLLTDDRPLEEVVLDVTRQTTAVLLCTGAGITIVEGTAAAVVATTDARVDVLEHLQHTAGDGPSCTTIRTGLPTVATDLDVWRERWPALAARAEEVGLPAAASLPLRQGGAVGGSLNLYHDRPRAWSDPDLLLGGLLADVVAASVVNLSRLEHARNAARQLQTALDSRIVIEQAKGIVAGVHNVSTDEAFTRIRTHARNRNLSLRSVADAVVNLGLRP